MPSGHRIHIYATRQDWTRVLSSLEEAISVKYVPYGNFPTRTVQQIAKFTSLPLLGEALSDSAVLEPKYLVTEKNDSISVRPIQLYNGTTSYAVDLLWNPNALVISFGGLTSSEQALLAGEISTLKWPDPIFQYLSKTVKREFAVVKAFRVGAEAMKLFQAGCRLTNSLQSPPEYDLSLD
jgi:hypothetical protein